MHSANGTFYLMSHDNNQPIKLTEFNGALYNDVYCILMHIFAKMCERWICG